VTSSSSTSEFCRCSAATTCSGSPVSSTLSSSVSMNNAVSTCNHTSISEGGCFSFISPVPLSSVLSPSFHFPLFSSAPKCPLNLNLERGRCYFPVGGRHLQQPDSSLGSAVAAPKFTIWGLHERRQRNAEGKIGRRFPLPADYGVLGGVVSSPSGVQGGAPAENDFSAFSV